ncbi:MAG: acyl-CoA dehydrogenase family protein [Anaerotignum sp.]
MSILLTEDQKEIQAMVRDFVKKEFTWDVVRKYDEKGEFPMELYKKVVEMGLPVLTIPEEFGGMDMGMKTWALVSEELGYGDAGFAVSVGAQELASTPIMLYGNDEQKADVAERLLNGQLAGFGLTEAASGSDAANCKTTAVRDGDHYILNGTKAFITNAGIAGFYTVFASTDPEKKAKGISAFIVEADRPGVSAGKEEDKMGIRLSHTAELVLQDVRIPAKNLIGEEGMGFMYAMGTLERTRPAAAASACGICQSAIDKCIEYAKVRKTFGKYLIEQQAIQYMLADMEIQTQAARALLWKCADEIDAGKPNPILGCATKTFASDTAVKVATDAIQIFGGYGFSREYPIEILLRNAKIYQIFEGTNQIQRNVMGGLLAKR